MDLYKQIKQIASEAASAAAVKLYYGTVLTVNSLSVQVDQRFILTSEFLTLCRSASELAAGDRVALILMGDSDYLILDKVV
ncbi:MAG: hypothetical protein H6Q60_1423 [Oscillospiraceae bacterium]|nr:hypothetical protein [Oscillospiraceae bacterium]